jgi:hypothetical protein
MLVHVLRAVTLVAIFVLILTLPQAIARRIPTRRVWLIVLVLELEFVGSAVAIADSWNKPVIWYRLPRVMVMCATALAYVAWEWRDRHHR